MRGPKFTYRSYRRRVRSDGVWRWQTDWRWHLKGGNGEIIASGEAYATRAGVRRGIRAVVRCAMHAGMEEA